MTFRYVRTLAAVGSLLAIFVSPALAQEHQYVGLKDCSRCHKKELMGDQTGEWKKTRHSKAFETLKGDEAIQIAKDRGITTPPHETDDCVKCHATAYGVTAEMMKKPLQLSDGVQCESCHGPGADYRKKKTMSDRDKSIAAGMWEPGKDEKICLTCHNDESPTWDPAKGFDFAEAKKTIAHPIPEHVKGRYIELEKEARKKKGGSEEEEEEEE
jgi:hypothetical protein